MAFFDDTLGLYICTTPLTISSQVLQAAEEIGITLQWDSQGFICRVSYDIAIALSKKLGMVTLSVSQFMNLALRRPEVASPNFAEWFTDSYTLENPEICHNGSGEVVYLPVGRPGWFKLKDIDTQGFPTKVSERNALGRWKYWSPNPNDIGVKCGAMRSFVTSSGTCSLDLGIPVQARHPKVMIRECYKVMRAEDASPIESIWNDYIAITNSKNDAQIKEFIRALDLKSLELGHNANTLLNAKEQERKIELLGKQRLLSGAFAELQIIDMSHIKHTLSISPSGNTTYVVGHNHPDADSVVSAVFEATRRNGYYPNQVSLPWTPSIPSEVSSILGTELTGSLAKVHKFESHHSVVLVDCHHISGTKVNESQVKGVIDHHYINEVFPEYVSVTQENSWSTTIQVYIRILGSGFDLDSETARILAEATMLEAEPQLMQLRPALDRLALDRLIELAGDQTRDYGSLLQMMMVEKDFTKLFYKDYRQTSFGFAVIHCTEYTDFTSIANANNIKAHLPVSVIKQILARKTAPWIESERITIVFNDTFYDKGFRNAAATVLKEACQAFHRKKFNLQDCYIDLEDIETQTPRPWLTPHLEKIVREHLKFMFSTRIGRYISSGFYSGKTDLYGLAEETQKPTAHLSYNDVKALLRSTTNTTFMTLKQYWEVYNELSDLNDSQFISNLRDKSYVEVLDTFIKSGSEILGQKVNITPASPGLIQPCCGDEETGIPTTILDPNNYDDNDLWRYWSPDGDENVATRGHIFVLDRTSLDLKITPDEKTSQLTFRPVYRDIPDLKFCIQHKANGDFEVKVIPRLFSIFETPGDYLS